MKRVVQDGLMMVRHAWFSLTTQERTTAVIITGIFLIGAITRWVLR